MLFFFKSFQGLAPHSLGGGIRSDQFRKLLLQFVKLVLQRIQSSAGNLLFVQDMIQVAVAVDYLFQLLYSLFYFGLSHIYNIPYYIKKTHFGEGSTGDEWKLG